MEGICSGNFHCDCLVLCNRTGRQVIVKHSDLVITWKDNACKECRALGWQPSTYVYFIISPVLQPTPHYTAGAEAGDHYKPSRQFLPACNWTTFMKQPTFIKHNHKQQCPSHTLPSRRQTDVQTYTFILIHIQLFSARSNWIQVAWTCQSFCSRHRQKGSVTRGFKAPFSPFSLSNNNGSDRLQWIIRGLFRQEGFIFLLKITFVLRKFWSLRYKSLEVLSTCTVLVFPQDASGASSSL